MQGSRTRDEPLRRLTRLLMSNDFRSHPWSTLRRRVEWRVRRKPILVDPWADDLRIALPATGTAARVYYHGFSDPDLADLIRRTVQPGFSVLDVGAHIGEYTLLAAHRVGSRGRVLSIEPNTRLAEAITRNVALNGLDNVSVQTLAVGESPGVVRFWEDQRSRGGWVTDAYQDTRTVERVTLDALVEREGCPRIDVAKIDAAGAERAVIRGATRICLSDRLPTIFVKLYAAEVVSERFGGDNLDLVDLLLEFGYRLSALTPALDVTSRRDAQLALAGRYGAVLVARRTSG